MKIVAQTTEKIENEDKLFNFRPVFFAAVFLCLGIAFGYACIVHGLSTWWKCSLILLFLPIFFCQNDKKHWQTVFAVALLICSFLCGETAFRIKIDEYTSSGYFSDTQTVVGRVIEMREYDFSTHVLLTDVSVGGISVEGNFNAYLPASFCENVRLSDRVLVTAKIKTTKALFDEYGFAAYRIGADIRYTLYSVEDMYVVGHQFDLFLSAQEKMISVIEAGMAETPAAVTIALFTGDTQGIDDALLANVRYGGIAHIFAVSGLHVGALYMFSQKLFSKSKFPKGIEVLILAGVFFFYAGICGFSPSVVRAVVICLTAHIAKSLWLKTDFLQSLGGAAIVVLLFSPTALFEVGFQLSFAACLGLALLACPIQKGLERGCERIKKCVVKIFRLNERARPQPQRKSDGNTSPLTLSQRIVRASISFIATCLAASIATAPIQMQTFGYLSGWSLLLNCLFVPLISGAFACFLLLTGIACFLPTLLGNAILYTPSVVWSALLLFFETVDLSTFALTGMPITGGAMVAYYGGLQFLSDKWNIDKRLKYALAGLFFVGFIACIIITSVVG